MQLKLKIATIVIVAFIIQIQDNIVFSESVLNKQESLITNPFLYKIEINKNASYIFGTANLNDSRLLNLPDIVLQTIDNSQLVFTEWDKVQKEGFEQWKYYLNFCLPPDMYLKNLLPEGLYKKVQEYVIEKGGKLYAVERMKIFTLDKYIESLSVSKTYFTQDTQSDIIYNIAVQKKKSISYLEDVAELTRSMDKISSEIQIQILSSTLENILQAEAEDRNMMEEYLKEYFLGNEVAIVKNFEDSTQLDSEFDELYMEQFLNKRSEKLSARINSVINKKQNETIFFLVQLQQLVGENGILKILGKKGYKITRVGSEKEKL